MVKFSNFTKTHHNSQPETVQNGAAHITKVTTTCFLLECPFSTVSVYYDALLTDMPI